MICRLFRNRMKERVRLLQIEENKRAVQWARDRGAYVVPPPLIIVDASGYFSTTREGWQQYIEENKNVDRP